MSQLDLLTGDAHAFLEEAWGRRIHVHTIPATELAGIFDIEQADHLITQTAIRTPQIRMAQDGSVLALAGLWEVWGRGEDRLYTCTVVTSPAVGPLQEIHDRMPLVLPRERWAEWLDPGREDVEQLTEPTAPEVVEALELRPVSTAVNNVGNNGRQLTERAETVAEPADQPALF